MFFLVGHPSPVTALICYMFSLWMEAKPLIDAAMSVTEKKLNATHGMIVITSALCYSAFLNESGYTIECINSLLRSYNQDVNENDY